MAILFTILGIGLLLLLHEAGHYYAARIVGIRVKVFSLGFGHRIFGWHRNGCDFRLAWIPLGGYVRVAGEDPSATPKPGDLFYASAPRRLLFYSGGILINFLFAFLMIPILFLAGVPFEAPVVGSVSPGEAAWEAGVRSGDRVLEVGGRSIYGFRHVHSAIALAPRESAFDMVVQSPGGQPRNVLLTPDYDEGLGFQGIGIGPLTELTFTSGTEAADSLGDGHIVSIDGIATSHPMLSAALIARAGLEGRGVEVGISAKDGQLSTLILNPETDPLPDAPPQIGIAPLYRGIMASRGALGGIFPAGEELISVNGQAIRGIGDVLLRVKEDGALRSFQLRKAGSEEILTTTLPQPLALEVDQVAAELHLASLSEVRYLVYPGSPAALAGLVDGCRVLRVDGRPVRSFEELRDIISTRAPAGETSLQLAMDVLNPGETESRSLTLTLAPVPYPRFDLVNRVVMEEVRTASPWTATVLGFREAKSMVSEVFTFLSRMIGGEISARKNLGGIITIGTATHSFANQGLIPLLFFLCMISVNLGVLNLMPIPALDGGHIMFALYEIVRRRPVSISVQNGFQVVGFFLVVFLLIAVTTLDIQRLVQ